MRVEGPVRPGDLAGSGHDAPPAAYHLPGGDHARRVQGQRLDDVHLQFEGGVRLATVERGVHGTAHGRVEQSAENAAVHRPDGVVQVLADVKAEGDLAWFDADDTHPEQGGDRRRRGPPLGDAGQVVQAAQIAGEGRADEGILPGGLATPRRRCHDGLGRFGHRRALWAEFSHGTQSWGSAFHYATLYACVRATDQL